MIRTLICKETSLSVAYIDYIDFNYLLYIFVGQNTIRPNFLVLFISVNWKICKINKILFYEMNKKINKIKFYFILHKCKKQALVQVK